MLGVDALEDQPCVLGGGDGGEDCDDLKQDALGGLQRRHMEDETAHDCDDADDLDECVELAEHAGAEVAQSVGGVEQGGDKKDAEVAAEDEHSDVAGNESDVGEDEEEGAEEELVGYGVEILTEGGLLLEQASEEAVESITDTGEEKEGERGAVAAIEDLNDEIRNDEEPREGEEIGRGSELA